MTAHLLEEADACAVIEVMEEIRQQDEIVGAVVIHIESAARQLLVTAADAGPGGIRGSDLQYGSPVESDNAGLRILLRDLDPEQSVPRGDVEHLHGGGRAGQHDGSERTRHGGHHRRHAVGKLDPYRIFRLHGPFAWQIGASVPDDVRQMPCMARAWRGFRGRRAVAATHDGDRGSRKAALVGECE